MSRKHQPADVVVESGVARVVFRRPGPAGDGHPDPAAVVRDVIEEAALSEGARVVLLLMTDLDEAPEGTAGAIAAIPQPVVAAMTGRVFDRTLEAALAADIRLCDDEAWFGLTQVQRGLLPCDGGTQRLPRVVGPGLAADMILTGRELTADEALAAGLVTEIVPAGRLADRAGEIAGAIAERGALAGRYTKEAVRRGADMPLAEALRLEADLSVLLHADPERAEGIAAFRERRPPRFPIEDA